MNNRSSAACVADDAALVDQVRRGDHGAFARLYERHELALFRTALAMTRDRGVAEEILQETFLRAYRHVDRIDLDDGASLRPWLYRIVINLVYDWSARQRFAARPVEGVFERLVAAPGLTPERQTEDRELEQIVAEAIAQLPFGQRVAVVLFYVHDMDLKEIASIMNVPEGTVKSRLYYGRARLREHLAADARLPVGRALRVVSSS